jgi:hypothetical protein
LDELDPGDLRHHQIRQDQVHRMGFQPIQGLSTVSRRHDQEPGSLEKPLQNASEADVVIDQKNQSLGWFCGGHPLMWVGYRSLGSKA